MVASRTTAAEAPGAFGLLLQQYRAAAGLSQEELAELAGLSRRGISDLERGRRRVPHPDTLRRLLDALGVREPDRVALLRAARGQPVPAQLMPPAWSGYLPRPLSSFVGRERELVEIRELLERNRLVTLTGVGGIGKTRLALRIAAELLDAGKGPIVLVELASLSDATRLTETVGSALGIREQPGRSPTALLIDALRQRPVLLLVDNCEHVVDACAKLVAELLAACPGLRILATSREALGVSGECVLLVPPLSMAHEQEPGRTEVQLSEAAQLLAERAAEVAPTITPTADNIATIERICHQLDGIPLALELAAARVRLLGVEQIAARLNKRFALLVGGSRTAPARHQTLRATVEWSYDLLDDRERRLFERLAVFAGGWLLESAEAVCAGDGVESAEVLDVMGQLVNKSLVVVDPMADGGVRYRMLETLRQYARERLVAGGHEPGACTRHALYFLELAEAAAPHLRGRDQVTWLARLERDHDNLRTALAWSLEHLSGSETALRLAGALYQFWWARGHLAEGRTWLARALERDARLGGDRSPVTKQAYHRALEASGVLARQQGDYHVAESLFRASVALARELKDSAAIAESLYWLGSIQFFTGNELDARALAEESLTLYRQLGNRGDTRRPLGILANLALTSGNYEQAIALHKDRLLCAREAGDTLAVAGIQCYLGELAGEQGQHDRATRLLDASYRTYEEFEHPEGMARALADQAWVARARGNSSRAKQQFRRSLVLFQKLGATWGIADCLVGMARLAKDGAQFDIAARLFGSAAMLPQAHSIRFADDQVVERAAGARARVERDLDAVRAALGTRRFDALWQVGCELTIDDAVTLALSGVCGGQRAENY